MKVTLSYVDIESAFRIYYSEEWRKNCVTTRGAGWRPIFVTRASIVKNGPFYLVIPFEDWGAVPDDCSRLTASMGIFIRGNLTKAKHKLIDFTYVTLEEARIFHQATPGCVWFDPQYVDDHMEELITYAHRQQ